jgi:hypothetical protein
VTAPWTSKHPTVQAGNEEGGDPGPPYPPAEMRWHIIPKNIHNEHDQQDPWHIGKDNEPKKHLTAAQVPPIVRVSRTAPMLAHKHPQSPHRAGDLSSAERESTVTMDRSAIECRRIYEARCTPEKLHIERG